MESNIDDVAPNQMDEITLHSSQQGQRQTRTALVQKETNAWAEHDFEITTNRNEQTCAPQGDNSLSTARKKFKFMSKKEREQQQRPIVNVASVSQSDATQSETNVPQTPATTEINTPQPTETSNADATMQDLSQQGQEYIWTIPSGDDSSSASDLDVHKGNKDKPKDKDKHKDKDKSKAKDKHKKHKKKHKSKNKDAKKHKHAKETK
ncbi:hypothetical protein RFI_05408 [Reticulomyxa filosa]|uniref:Uncharacterized protein n=1 Tax=Reticulomyxa filosa TaxID=46433 RepID=X6P0F0_RETFI|nr:hypothetical protein RFI_05408 [Reticulomyxa filosa]|eukprot:ETO31711.1 hypothetical protein RFI_05408 [Reticulomyxa filosa]